MKKLIESRMSKTDIIRILSEKTELLNDWKPISNQSGLYLKETGTFYL